MIPPLVASECKSLGEREIFTRLRDDPVTDGWIVLHSLDVARHLVQVVGEIDFVIVVPGKGVLCLEVKACREVHRLNGLWYYGHPSSAEPDVRGPFRQAAEAMHSIRERVTRRAPALARVPFFPGVVFPYLEFSITSEEWHEWQVIDVRAFKSRSFGSLAKSMMERARDQLAHTPTATWFVPSAQCPTDSEAATLAQLLRPDFEFFQSPRTRIQELDEEVKRYTGEQFGGLEAMGSNPRVLFTGPAGTGKTMLAIEAVRRAGSEGRRVLFLCFNRLLAKKLAEETAAASHVTTCTLHRHMLTVAQHEAPAEAAAVYWEQELPDLAIERLLTDPGGTLFDQLIVDEAQDIIREQYLDVLDLSVRGGLAAGRWMFFGDFESQVIYASDASSLDALIQRRASNVARYSLRVNCRNTPRIAELAQLLGGLSPRYRRVLRPDDGVEPEILYYADAAQQCQKLTGCLEGLYKAGFRGTDIVVLSTRAHASCAGSVTTIPWRDRLRPLGQDGPPAVGYSSIHAFKGLEARAIVVTDIDRIGDPSSQALFYVATTRALHRLVILAHENVRSQARAIVRRQLEQPEG